MGYDFLWEGYGNATLQKVEFLKEDGLVLSDKDDIQIEAYIGPRKIGSLSESTILEEDLDKKLLSVKNYKVENSFYLVLRVQVNSFNTHQDVASVRITYEKFGLTQ